LTEKDIQTIKEKLTEKEKLDNLDIKDLDMKDLVPQSFNGTVVFVLDDKHVIFLPVGMDGPKFKTFRKSNGGVFNRDVLAWKRGKEHGKYLLIEGHGERKIVRLIEDEELLLFKTLKLIKGIVKDKPYMLVRNLEFGGKLTSDGRYIEKENSEHDDDVPEMVVTPQVKVVEEDHDVATTSVSLFDE